MTDGYELMKHMEKRIAELPAEEKKYIAERILEEVKITQPFYPVHG